MTSGYNYSINAGKLVYQPTDKNGVSSLASYLNGTYGFSNTDFSSALFGMGKGVVGNPEEFTQEYKELFGKDLAVTDGYKFFETGNTDYMPTLLTSSTLNYKAGSEATDRTGIYKEMFLEKFDSSAASSAISVSGNSFNFSNYKFDTVDATGNYILDVNKNHVSKTISNSGISKSTSATDLQGMYLQLESEATKLKSELHESTLSFDSSTQAVDYPVMGYTSSDAQVKLLQQQMDVAMQEFLTIYDNLFAQFKIKAGAHVSDNQDGDRKEREQEAATAATLTATLAMDYAEKYYSQDVKPTAKDYIFGQAPMAFANKSTAYQNQALVDSISPYLDPTKVNTDQLNALLVKASNTSGKSNYVINSTSIDSKLTSANYTAADTNDMGSSMLWGMASTQTLTHSDETGDDRGSHLEAGQLKEIGSNVNDYVQWMVRDSFGVGGLTADIANSDYCASDAGYLSTSIIAAAQKLVNIKMQLTTASVEASINNKVLAEYEARLGAMQAIKTIMCPNGTDPYTVDIDGQKYILGQDNDKDGTVSSVSEILGSSDSKENIFGSLKQLDTNNDGYVSQEELQAQNITLSALDNTGKLSSQKYDMSLVKGINLASLQKTGSTDAPAGKFTMDLQDKQVNGDVTFEDSAYFQKLFGLNFSSIDNIDEDSSVAPIVIPTTAKSTAAATTTTTVATPAATPAASSSTTTDVAKTESTSAETATVAPSDSSTTAAKTDGFAFDFSDASDNKSTIEKLLDQLCWKLGITDISSSQKYSIIDSIDPTADATTAEAEIQNDLAKFNLSA